MSDKTAWKEQLDSMAEAWRVIKAAFKLGPPSNPLNVYETRRRGREYCYAARYGETGNPEELKKIADYAHILCGVRLAEDGEGEGDPS